MSLHVTNPAPFMFDFWWSGCRHEVMWNSSGGVILDAWHFHLVLFSFFCQKMWEGLLVFQALLQNMRVWVCGQTIMFIIIIIEKLTTMFVSFMLKFLVLQNITECLNQFMHNSNPRTRGSCMLCPQGSRDPLTFLLLQFHPYQCKI